jgi:hypothetical protein
MLERSRQVSDPGSNSLNWATTAPFFLCISKPGLHYVCLHSLTPPHTPPFSDISPPPHCDLGSLHLSKTLGLNEKHYTLAFLWGGPSPSAAASDGCLRNSAGRHEAMHDVLWRPLVGGGS